MVHFFFKFHHLQRSFFKLLLILTFAELEDLILILEVREFLESGIIVKILVDF